MERERTSVGLAVHARSVVACGIDDETGELCSASRFLAGVDSCPLTIKESVDVTSTDHAGAGEGPGRVEHPGR